MKSTSVSIIIASLIIAGAFLISKGGFSGSSDASGNNVTMRDNVQVVELKAKGGYWPRISTAKAGIPTVLRVNTEGTYDCSASLRIPSLSIGKLLPSNGTTEIALGTPQAGKLNGTCGMGMYNFQIDFQ